MPLVLDGMRYNNMNGYGGGYNTNYAVNNGSVQEVTVDTGSLSADSVVSGVRMNIVPKEGGNTYKGFFLTNFTNHSMESTNLTPELRAFGLTAVPGIEKIWDINPAGGGPIVSDRLWIYSSFRYGAITSRAAPTTTRIRWAGRTCPTSADRPSMTRGTGARMLA